MYYENMNEITSLQNPKVQHVRKLKDSQYRKQCGQYIVEGYNLVKDLPSDLPVREVFATKNFAEDYNDILKRYPNDCVNLVDEKVMKAISETVTPSGILLVADYVEKTLDLSGNVVVTDGVSDPGNMGTIIRTCAACGIKQLVAIDSVDCFSGKVIRASMGGVFKISIVKMQRSQALEALSAHSLYVLDMNGKNIYDIGQIKNPFALVVGSESRGISDEFRNAGQTISLPMKGDMESLNAAVSLSVALYKLVFDVR